MATIATSIAEMSDLDEKDIKDTLGEKAIKALLAQGKPRRYSNLSTAFIKPMLPS